MLPYLLALVQERIHLLLCLEKDKGIGGLHLRLLENHARLYYIAIIEHH